MPLIDSHAHLDMYPADELPGVLARAYAAGVRTILAIGIGDAPPDIQRAAFLDQLRIAAAARKPILIHCRTSSLATPQAKAKFGPADAWKELLTLLAEHWQPHSRNSAPAGIMHCFSGGVDEARRSLSLAFHPTGRTPV